MENALTIPVNQAIRERLERVEARRRYEQELSSYLAAVKASDRVFLVAVA